MMTCRIDGCEAKTVGRGLCRKHYARWWRWGDPSVVKRKAVESLADLLARTKRNGDCLEWQRSKNAEGYGSVAFAGRIWSTHRLSYTLAVGVIPDGLLVCHHCDNPSCINPAHLFVGTNGDNVRDSVRKGRNKPPPHPTPERQARGERQWKSRLTDDAVRDIRANYSGKYGEQRALAKKHGVSAATVGHVVAGRTWRHVA